MRAFFREQVCTWNRWQAVNTIDVFTRAMIFAFATFAIVLPRSNSRAAAETAPAKSESAQAPTSLALQGAAWTGDFDEMLKRRYIRVLWHRPKPSITW
jgi:hypothetical protein